MNSQPMSNDFQSIQARLAELVLAAKGNGDGTITDIGSHFIVRLECAIEKEPTKKIN